MVEIQNMNNMHAQKMDVLQNKIYGLIFNLWTLHSNARKKKTYDNHWTNEIRVGIKT